ncbi:hypothetical protein SUGI_0662260 [Cryptomeria japonica]|nr:hypothetical protein SUGI_0662260 [Cryptomeria japonica]
MYNCQSWVELIDHNTFSQLESLAWLWRRIQFCSFWSCGGWHFLYFFCSAPLVMYNRHLGNTKTSGIFTVVSFAFVFFTNVMSAVIFATMVGLVIVCVHGAFKTPKDLFSCEHSAVGVTKHIHFAPTVATHVYTREY